MGLDSTPGKTWLAALFPVVRPYILLNQSENTPFADKNDGTRARTGGCGRYIPRQGERSSELPSRSHSNCAYTIKHLQVL